MRDYVETQGEVDFIACLVVILLCLLGAAVLIGCAVTAQPKQEPPAQERRR